MNLEKLKAISGLSITEKELNLLNKYVSLLISWNKKINLVSRKLGVECFVAHVVPSLLFARVFEFKNKFVLDVGTGGGLPGIPLSIINPTTKFVLCDSIQKKITAVENMCVELGLENATTSVGRAESLAQFYKKNKFNFVVARGVASLKTLIEYSFAITTDKSFLLTLKGGDLNNEKNEALKSFPYIEVEEILLSDIVSENDFWNDKKFIIVKRK